MRRILIFSLVYYPRFIGGAEVAIKEITDRIPGNDIEFDMVTLRLDVALPKFEKIGNVNIYRVGWTKRPSVDTGKSGGGIPSSDSLPWYLHLNKYAMPITAFIQARKLAKLKKYDAMWSMMATYNSFAALFFKLTHPKIPFILTLQEGDPIPYIKRRALPMYPLFKMIFTRADHIQTISKYLADWAKDMGAKCPVTVVPNAVDFKYFSKPISEADRHSLELKTSKKAGDVFLITTSRLVVKNAVGDIIQALTYLPSNVKLLILGQGYQEADLKAQAIRLSLNHVNSSNNSNDQTVGLVNQITGIDKIPKVKEDRVQFLGYVPHKDMPPYLQISDIFIRPSLSEGFGNSYIEAMAAGIPVIATPVGGIVDFLHDGETGLFCEVGNPRSIAQKVEKYLKDKESREYIVKNAKVMVEKEYEWDKIAGEMKEVFLKF